MLMAMRFSVTPWPQIEGFYLDLTVQGATFVQPMLDLTRSIVAEGASGSLAAHTSMHDLVVTSLPVSTDPDWLRVSLRSDTLVRISHETCTGPGDALERPQAQLLPLFWRFAILKWGIHPDRDLK
jgi:hypothetical protein